MCCARRPRQKQQFLNFRILGEKGLCCALVYIRILSIRYAIRPKAAVF